MPEAEKSRTGAQRYYIRKMRWFLDTDTKGFKATKIPNQELILHISLVNHPA